ncbi:hypothetical protein AVEN_52811-1 [Araneus ventricosus]|uniref:Uncharacterized protein n=1 Tax=Araneus ventricosus TaxID=182803 RepID=A0A4Y2RA32_ARAVE|nr:hypothetical protein AVEN_52811-1 [Araneus ventricosus]
MSKFHPMFQIPSIVTNPIQPMFQIPSNLPNPILCSKSHPMSKSHSKFNQSLNSTSSVHPMFKIPSNVPTYPMSYQMSKFHRLSTVKITMFQIPYNVL